MKFYRMRLVETELGVSVITENWISLAENNTYHHCVLEIKYLHGPSMMDRIISHADKQGIKILQAAKDFRYKIKRVYKSNSRFAFETEEKALQNLRFLKEKQLKHIKAKVEIIETFLAAKSLENNEHENMLVVPNSQDVVFKHYRFD